METEIKIRGYHTDLYQHVNNARYLEFLEEGRWQLLEDHMDLNAFASRGFSFFVVNINIDYKSPARVNDEIRVRSGLERIGNKSAVIRQEVINKTNGRLSAVADVTFVIADAQGRPLKIEGDLEKYLTRMPRFEAWQPEIELQAQV